MTEPLANEKELLNRCVGGDVSAFEPIVRAYQGRAYHYALSIVSNHHDALDLAQQAFAKAFRSLHTFDPSRSFLPWFLRIVRNLCFDALSKRKRQPEKPGSEDGLTFIDFIAASGDDPARAAARREQAEAVRHAVQALPPGQREVVFLRHFEDLSYEGIAAVLDIPIGTVMSRLFNGRRKLAQILKSRGDAE